MNVRSIRILSQTFSFFLFTVFSAASADAQTERFHFQPEKVLTGTIFFYNKSNLDGTNPGRIAVYVAAQDRLESFKWHEGADAATLVIADLDWKTFTVRRFESLRLFANGERKTQAVLEKIAGKPRVKVQAGTYSAEIDIKNWPWQSYDFDFAGLSIIFPHLRKPKVPFTIGISDVIRTADGMAFGDKGPVTLRYESLERLAGGPLPQIRHRWRGVEKPRRAPLGRRPPGAPSAL